MIIYDSYDNLGISKFHAILRMVTAGKPKVHSESTVMGKIL